MAEEKKEGGGGGGDIWESIEWIIIIVFGIYLAYRLIIGLYYGVQGLLQDNLGQDNIIRRLLADPSMRNLRRLGETSFLGAIIMMVISYTKYVLFGISAIFIAISVRFFRRIVAMSDTEDAVMATPPAGYVQEEDPAKKRWRRIVEYAQSDNPSNWRLAILEADIILDEILDVNGYRGDTVGEKLKQVEPSDMQTLNDAWEAHKIRNAIAHQGEMFTLTEREARRVIGLFEKVFKEYEFL